MSRDALVVGINTYTNLQVLETPSRDAEAIAQMLISYGDFKVRRLPAVRNRERNTVQVGSQQLITLTALQQALVQLFNPIGENIPETAIFYFSGHGLRKAWGKGFHEGFLATSDINLDSNWGLSLKWLRDLLASSPIKQQIVWLDCCYSGELFNFDEADPGDRGSGRGRCFIAASREYELAYEEVRGHHGILTGALLEGLDPTRQPDGIVSNHILVDSIKSRLQEAPQLPIFRNSGYAIHLTGRGIATINPKVNGISPYKGLAYFDCTEEDAEYFYGRTALTDQLLEQVRKGDFLAVLGASGSGKSSLVRAGLLYQIKLGQRLSGSDRWQSRIFRPGEHPLRSLSQVFVDEGLSPVEFATQLAKAEDLLQAGANGLRRLVTAIAGKERFVLVVDQFEEIFTLCQSDVERSHFLQYLMQALDLTDNQLCLVITMRSDFFGKCTEQEYAGLASRIQEHLVTVIPLTSKELREVIIEPAKKVELEVEHELVDQILADAEGPGSLPLLQYTLTELWQRRTVDRLTLTEYMRLGGVKGALQKRADEIYDSLTPEEQLTAKSIFLALTQLGEGTEDTRRQIRKQDLVASQYSATLVDTVIQKLSTERLIVTSEQLQVRSKETEKVAIIDIAHEALIRHWQQLRQWINVSRDDLRKQRDIEEDAKDWEEHDRRKDYLLRGLKLSEAKYFLKQSAALTPLSPVAQELVRLSVENRSRGWFLLSSIVVIVVAALTGSTIYARNNEQHARIESIRAQIRSAEALLTSNPFEALTTAIRVERQSQEMELARSDLLSQLHTVLWQAAYETREYNLLEGHKLGIRDVQFSPDGQTIASGSEDGTIKLWKHDGSLISTLKGHTDWVNAVTFSPNGQTIISAGNDETIRFWKLDGTLIKTIDGRNGGINSVQFSPNGQMIISGDDNGAIRLWKSDGTLMTTIHGHQDWVIAVRFSPDGQTITSVDRSGIIKLWKLGGNQFKVLKTIKGHLDQINDIQFSPDGQMFSSASNDQTIKLWKLDGHLIRIIRGHEEGVSTAKFSTDRQTLASASGDGTIKLWRLDGTLIKTLKGHQAWVNAIQFSPDGKTIVSASQDKTLRLWRLDHSLITTLRGHQSRITTIQFSPDGKILASASEDKTVKLWKYNDNPIPTTLKGHSDWVNALQFSPDGQLIASVSSDRTIRLWQSNGRFIAALKGHQSTVNSAQFSPDNRLIASASDDQTIRLWSRNGKALAILKGHQDAVNFLQFSPNGQMLASAGRDKNIRLWKSNGTLIAILKGHKDAVLRLQFSPDGQILASTSADGTIKLWRLDGKLIRTLEGHKGVVWSVQFSPDSQMLATAGMDNTIKLWRRDGTLIKTLTDHDNGVVSIQFSPSGQILASASFDRTVKLWSLEGRLIKTFKGHKDGILDLQFSPDGRRLASAGEDGLVIVWDVELHGLLERTCHWLHDYFKIHSEVDEDRIFCNTFEKSAL